MKPAFVIAALGALLLAGAAPEVSLVSAAQAQSNVASARDVVIVAGSTTFRLKSVEVAGGPASDAELAKLLDPAAPQPVAERLANFSAASVRIPELTIETRVGGRAQTFVYRDVVFEGVERGKARAVGAQGASFTLSDPVEGEAQGAYGRIDARNLDLALAVRMSRETAAASDARKAPLYDGLSVEGVHFESAQIALDAQGVTVDRAFGRPPAEAARGAGDSGPQAQKRLTQMEALRWLDAIGLKGVGLKDLRLTLRSGDSPLDLKVARLFLPKLDGPRIEAAQAEDISYARDERAVTVATAQIKALDLEVSVGGKAGDPARPAFGALMLGGVSGSSPERSEEKDFTLDRLEIVNGASADSGDAKLDVAFDGLDARLPSLVALGYAKLGASGRLSALWRREARELSLSDFSLDATDMGSFKLTAQFAGVGADLASSDPDLASSAVREARLKSLDMTFVNRGLVEKALAAQAAREQVSVDEARQSDMSKASLVLPALMGNAPPLRVIGSEAAKFIADPKSFSLVVRSAQGVGLRDLDLISSPAAFFKKVEMTAFANR